MSSKVAHVSHNTGEHEWYTPQPIIEAARLCMGGIDLDPASSDKAQEMVKATTYYTKATNGLQQQWRGRVWMNPPYAKGLIGPFIDKVLTENVQQAIVLVNNATETHWGKSLLAASAVVCFPARRVRFLDPEGNPGAPLQGQMICGLKVNRPDFTEQFKQFGVVL